MTASGFVALVGAALLAAGAQAQITALSSQHPEGGGGFASVVAALPDTNGDGKADIVIGAYNQKVGAILHAGRVTIYSGANGAALRVLVSPGKQTWGWFGASVAGVPDVTGDGVGDVLVGASNENNTGTPATGTGRAYLFSGATGAWVRTFNSPNGETGGGFGCAVAGLADITGDGKGDVAVGALREDPNAAPDNAGRVYIFNGATGALLRTLVSNHQATDGYFGQTLAPVPDATGDGKPDLVVGAPGETAGGVARAGRAHIYNPVTGAVFRTLTPGVPEAAGGFGNSVGGVPDASGDARGDVIVGALFEDGGGVFNAGRAYLFSGAAGTVLRSFVPGAAEAGDYFGAAVSGIPDVDGDGRGDVLIGAPGADPVGAPADSGRAYIFSGATGAFIRGLGSSAPEVQGGFGASVAGLPDTSGNTKGEAVVGAPREDTLTLDDVGRGYLVRN